MPRLLPVVARGHAFMDALVHAWDAGDAVVPIDPRLPGPAATALVDAMNVAAGVEDGVALVVATSGTTGAPKGVELTHAQVVASAEATSRRLGVDPASHRWLACLPLAHVGGLSVVTRALTTGTPVTVHDGFDAAAVNTASTGARACTHVSLVPTALARIDTHRWERIVVGGAAPPAVRPDNVTTTYGLTETGSGVVYDGVPLDGVEVRVDAHGTILVRGPMVATRYRDGSPVADPDGWLHTGDLGTWDGDRLTVGGRRDDVIVTGGENVFPDPVEDRLRAHPDVEDAAVIGRPDPEWGQRVVGVIVPASDRALPDLGELRDWVRDELPAWCAPKEIQIVDRLPRTSLGKLRRAALRRPEKP